MLIELLNHLFTIRRRDDVRDEGFRAELPDTDAGFARQGMLRRNNENKLIRVDDR